MPDFYCLTSAYLFHLHHKFTLATSGHKKIGGLINFTIPLQELLSLSGATITPQMIGAKVIIWPRTVPPSIRLRRLLNSSTSFTSISTNEQPLTTPNNNVIPKLNDDVLAKIIADTDLDDTVMIDPAEKCERRDTVPELPVSTGCLTRRRRSSVVVTPPVAGRGPHVRSKQCHVCRLPQHGSGVPGRDLSRDWGPSWRRGEGGAWEVAPRLNTKTTASNRLTITS